MTNADLALLALAVRADPTKVTQDVVRMYLDAYAAGVLDQRKGPPPKAPWETRTW